MATQPDEEKRKGSKAIQVIQEVQKYSSANGYPAALAVAVGLAIFAGEPNSAAPFAVVTYLAVRRIK
jgi:hypothetical protein